MRRNREPISLMDNLIETSAQFSEGNPGGLRIITELMQGETAPNKLKILLELDDLNIRGAQLWVAYKDVCDCNVEMLKQRLFNRDPELIEGSIKRCQKLGIVGRL